MDRIVQESNRNAGDQTNSEGSVVEVSNKHIMTLINQNNEILEKTKSLEKSQSEILQNIEELINPVVNLTPPDIPEQHEPLLTMFTLGILEQPQLELSLQGCQNVCQQSVSPVFSFNLPEQPQGNQILTINTNDYRDCVATHGTFWYDH